MGQILHANARTTQAVRKEIRNSKESIAKAATRFNVNPKTIIKWYNNERPHQALEYKTPDEKAYGFMDKFYNLPTTPQALQHQII